MRKKFIYICGLNLLLLNGLLSGCYNSQSEETEEEEEEPLPVETEPEETETEETATAETETERHTLRCRTTTRAEQRLPYSEKDMAIRNSDGATDQQESFRFTGFGDCLRSGRMEAFFWLRERATRRPYGTYHSRR